MRSDDASIRRPPPATGGRTRFVSYLAMAVLSGFLIVASYAFVANTFWWIALVGGVLLALLGIAEIGAARRRDELVVPAALVAVVGVVMGVIAVAATAATAANWGFALAIATAALAVIGLVGHEADAEREIDREHRHRPAMPAVS
jgi:peptidoglycan/LPS O-acetylase OafA/YrhL